MKNFITLLFCIFSVSFPTLLFANSNDLIFSDDLSNASAWETQGNGDVYIQDGKCIFNNVYSGDYNRAYRFMNLSLPTTYWRAECDFTITNPNPAGNGTGEVVLALTAGQLDFMSYNASTNYEETNQDGLAVVLLSDFSDDNDINNWYFFIEAKHGSVRTFDLNAKIFASASVSKYYIRLERTSEEMSKLSIFTDSAFMNELPGSPVTFAINPLISRLSFIQHGTITPGFYTRLINAGIDNDMIYDSPPLYENLAEVQGPGKLFIYPNPAHNRVYIKPLDEFSTGAAKEFRIFNLFGQEVEQHPGNTSNGLDISGLAEGVFILMVTGAEKMFWGRFEKH